MMVRFTNEKGMWFDNSCVRLYTYTLLCILAVSWISLQYIPIEDQNRFIYRDKDVGGHGADRFGRGSRGFFSSGRLGVESHHDQNADGTFKRQEFLSSDMNAIDGTVREAFPKEWLADVYRSLRYIEKCGEGCVSEEGLRRAWEDLRYGFLLRIDESGKVKGLAKLWNPTIERIPVRHVCRILDLVCSGDLKDVDFVFNTADEPMGTQDNPYPVFSWTKGADSSDLLIPYHMSFYNLPLQNDLVCDESIEKGIEDAWRKKNEKAVWRGATTGAFFLGDGDHSWREKARPKLVLMCKRRSDICDARISEYTQGAQVMPEMHRLLGPPSTLTAEEQDAFKYALVLDGNAAPSSRMRHHLNRTSLIVKQDSQFMEFFYPSLLPYIHYVPLAKSLHDLDDVIAWARQHDEEAMEMVKRSKRFACEYLNKETVSSFTKHVFSQYAKLFSGMKIPIDTADLMELDFEGKSLLEQCPDIVTQCPVLQEE